MAIVQRFFDVAAVHLCLVGGEAILIVFSKIGHQRRHKRIFGDGYQFRAFFEQALDIANWSVQRGIAQALGVDFADVLQRIETGEAIAHLAADYDLAQAMGVQGSPTYVLNEGRQKLFGDVGYGILAANVTELLAHARGIDASLCA